MKLRDLVLGSALVALSAGIAPQATAATVYADAPAPVVVVHHHHRHHPFARVHFVRHHRYHRRHYYSRYRHHHHHHRHY